ncbi:MAG: hypothetical protein HYZ16_07010 [Bacteroidetes bacterium]|jgi:chaperonin cofactor prefoldin|nr:hypothetical protein [Bacteroidota bacterium]
MKHTVILLFASLAIWGYGCKNEEEKRLEELEKEVLSLHDALMVKTENLVKLRTELGKAQRNVGNPIQRTAMKGIVALINASESFMEDWMAFFAKNKPTAETEIKDAIAFYENQLKDLDRMQKEMEEAYAKGLEWIEKHGNK